MLPVSQFFRQTIDERTTVNAGARLIAEWNQNRYASSVTVSTQGMVSNDPDIYPLESVIQPNRPTSGLPKAVVNDSKTSSKVRPYNFRIAGKESNYKYFSADNQSALSGLMINSPIIDVRYGSPTLTNKIVVTFETSIARPTDFTISVMINNAWVAIANSPPINSTTGQMILWYQGNGWSTTENLSQSVRIQGIRVQIRRLSRGRSRLNIIEVSARLVRDISDRIGSIVTTRSLQEPDLTLPVGVNSANSATIEIDNADRAFNQTGVGAFYGTLDRNVELRPYLGVNLRDYNGGIDSYEYVPQGIFYVDTWSSDDLSITASCYDYSTYLQSIMVAPSLFEDMTAGQIVSELMQRAGINNYNIQINESTPTVYKYYWIEDEVTLWDAIGDICKTDQSAAYFDEYGIFQFKHRDSILTQSTPNYALTSEDSGSLVSNIESLEEKFSVTANKVVIRYKPLKINEYRNTGVDSSLWNPNDTVTLRASELRRRMTSSQPGPGIASANIWLDPKEADLWPYESKVHINGEVLRYRGKYYWAYTGEYTRRRVLLTSADDKEKYDTASGIYVVKNTCTGELVTVERGLDGTTPRIHYSGNQIDWTMVKTYDTGEAGGRWGAPLRVPGGLAIIGPERANQTFYSAIRGASGDVHTVWGARMKFNPENSDAQMMGIIAHLQPDNEAGYYFELVGMDFATRYKIANLRCYKRFNDGRRIMLNGTGAKLNIVKDTWYQIDVTSRQGFWSVSINGIVAAEFRDTTFGNGKHGMFVRSDTRATFDYFYAAAPQSIPNIEDYRLRDRITGGFVSGYVMKAVQLHDPPIQSPNTSGEFMVFEEFGSIVHEIREMDVEFEKKPALSSSHYVTNDRVQVMGYVHNPFRAKFELANVGRGHQIAAGDDEVTIPGETLAQKILLYGQVIIEDEERTETVEDRDSIRKNGVVEVEVDNKWIQTEAQAKTLGKWFADNWGTPVDFVEASIFGNPALQVGDLVSVNFPDKDMSSATHRYIVMQINTTFNGSIQQDLTLRRHRL